MKLVQVTWMDARNDAASWIHTDEVKVECIEMCSVGYVRYENDSVICLVQSTTLEGAGYREGELVCNSISIPKGAVINRKDWT